MAHTTLKSGYKKLVDRLNRFPQGAPPSETLYAILKMLFSEREAELVASVPIGSFNVQEAAQRWHVSDLEAQKTLDALAGRAILLDAITPTGERTYVLPPPMAGFFEFSLMRLRGDIDQKALAELFYQYLNVEEDFIKALFFGSETQLGRAFVQESTLLPEHTLYVLDYERASEVIRQASHRGVGVCYCRHKMQHMERACDAPMDTCMTLNDTAASLIRHEYARSVDAAEGLDLLRQAQEHGLVQFGENGRRNVSFICNCCGCCCEAMIAARRFAILNPIQTTNFIPCVQEEACNGCGKCVNACPVEAMTLVSANDPHHPKLRKARLNEKLCLGCGVCIRTCSQHSLRLEQRPQRVITPLDSAHRTVLMAIERDMLPQLITDTQALSNHRALAAILGVILRLPPIQQALASKQMKSIYLERLILWGEKHLEA